MFKLKTFLNLYSEKNHAFENEINSIRLPSAEKFLFDIFFFNPKTTIRQEQRSRYSKSVIY